MNVLPAAKHRVATITSEHKNIDVFFRSRDLTWQIINKKYRAPNSQFLIFLDLKVNGLFLCDAPPPPFVLMILHAEYALPQARLVCHWLSLKSTKQKHHPCRQAYKYSMTSRPIACVGTCKHAGYLLSWLQTKASSSNAIHKSKISNELVSWSISITSRRHLIINWFS